MSDPNERDGISVTLKADGKDGTWIVFHGSPARIREQIIETFALEGESADAPLFDLVNEATRLYKAAYNLNSGVGGRVLPKGGDGPSSRGSAWEKVAGGNAAEEPEVDPNIARLTKAIDECASVDALREMYARNKVHFEAHADLKAAWGAKGKALSS